MSILRSRLNCKNVNIQLKIKEENSFEFWHQLRSSETAQIQFKKVDSSRIKWKSFLITIRPDDQESSPLESIPLNKLGLFKIF